MPHASSHSALAEVLWIVKVTQSINIHSVNTYSSLQSKFDSTDKSVHDSAYTSLYDSAGDS